MRLLAAVLPVLGGTAAEIRENVPLARVYAAYHLAMVQLGHDVQWPGIVQARRNQQQALMAELKQSATAPMSGALGID